MIDKGVLEETTEDTKWEAPTFCGPKKTEGVQTVSDFRMLNRAIKRSPWPMQTMCQLLMKVG